MDRRRFLRSSGLAAAGLLAACDVRQDAEAAQERERSTPGDGWSAVRAEFDLDPDMVQLSALMIAANPRPVREAIQRHREGLDRNPTAYLEAEITERRADAREAAADYLDVDSEEVALTDSTTMGLGIVYTGLRLEAGDDVLTTEHDFYATHESLRLAADRTGARIRRIRLFERPAEATADEIATRLADALRPETRLLAITWVHSDTGLALPMAAVAEVVAEANAGRDEEDRILVGLDAIHALGVKDSGPVDLGCDFYIAGCHKWLFGPRGTGIAWGRPEAWARCDPVIPSFIDSANWNAWARREAPAGPTTATRMSPGGYKPFEHRWAMAEAFRFHEELGRSRVEARTQALARRLKEGLAELPHVELHTPLDDALSGGIVSFDVEGRSPDAVVDHLRERGIVASTSPYAVSSARLSPAIYNNEEDVDTALREVEAMA